MILVAGALVALAVCASGSAVEDELLRELGSPDRERAAAAAAALTALGSEGHARLWSGFGEVPLRGRRARARWVLERSLPASVEAAVEHLEDPDREVRVVLVRFLGRVATDLAGTQRRARALARCGVRDGSAEVRAEVLTAAGALGGVHAVEALEALIDAWPPPERGRAAAQLAQLGAGREAVAARVRAGFVAPGRGARTPDPNPLPYV